MCIIFCPILHAYVDEALDYQKIYRFAKDVYKISLYSSPCWLNFILRMLVVINQLTILSTIMAINLENLMFYTNRLHYTFMT